MFWGCELRRKKEILLLFRGSVNCEVNSNSAPKKGERKNILKSMYLHIQTTQYSINLISELFKYNEHINIDALDPTY